MSDQPPSEMQARWRRHAARLDLDPHTLAAVCVTIVFWGSAFAGIRAALTAFTPAHVALLRYAIASVALALLAWRLHLRLPARRDLPGFALIGFVGFTFYNVALNYGEVSVPAATASFLIASTPVWIALLAILLFHERLRIWGWAGIALSFAGVATIALGQGGAGGFHLALPALLVLAAALGSSLYSVAQKPFLKRYTALECTAYAIWFGTLFLLPFGGGLIGEIHASALGPLAAIVFLALVPGVVGYATWSYVLSRVPAARAGSFLYLVPAMAMLVGWIWLGEVPPLISVIGGMLVLAGVILVNTRGRIPPPAVLPSE